MKRNVHLVAVAATAALLTMSAPVSAQPPAIADTLAIPGGPISTKIDPSLAAAQATDARVTVSLRLADPSLAEAVGADAKQVGARLSPAAQRDHVNTLKDKQRALSAKVSALGARQITTTQTRIRG